MRRLRRDIHVMLTGSSAGDCSELMTAMRAEGWHVNVIEDMSNCAAGASSGACDMVLIACSDPTRVQRQPVRDLMNLRADMSVLFLVGDVWEQAVPAALAGVTSTQIHRLSCPVPELMEVLKQDLLFTIRDQIQYTIMCVDDDKEFLASIKTFLPANLKVTLPRFDVDFEFFEDPVEALNACSQFGNRLGVVISDQIMPKMSGIEFLTRLKDMYPDVKRVLMTGYAGLDSAVIAINRRILDKYVCKPVDPVDFSESIRLLLSEHHLKLRAEMRQDRIMAQFEYIRAVTAAKKTKQVLQTTVGFLSEQICPVYAMVVMMNDGQLYLQAANDRVPGFPAKKHFPADKGLWGWLTQHRRPIRASSRKDLPEGADIQLPLPIIAVPVVRDNIFLGAILLSGHPYGGAFSREDVMLLEFVADIASVAIGSFKDREIVERNYVSTMASLMETVEARDSYTHGHTERVRALAVKLAQAAGITGRSLQEIEWAALLHDIGKIALPDAILLKASSLTTQEYAAVKDHPVRADRILQHLKYLDVARVIIRSHHERYDGNGYPDGLAGEEIPIGARILAIVDSYDAMTSARPYRKMISRDKALAEIAANAATQFDPRLAALFITIVEPGAVAPQTLSAQVNFRPEGGLA